MLRDAAAGHREILPLLQFTLEELYQRRTEDGMLTLAAYRELGGVEGSLARRAETVFKDLPDTGEAELQLSLPGGSTVANPRAASSWWNRSQTSPRVYARSVSNRNGSPSLVASPSSESARSRVHASTNSSGE